MRYRHVRVSAAHSRIDDGAVEVDEYIAPNTEIGAVVCMKWRLDPGVLAEECLILFFCVIRVPEW